MQCLRVLYLPAGYQPSSNPVGVRMGYTSSPVLVKSISSSCPVSNCTSFVFSENPTSCRASTMPPVVSPGNEEDTVEMKPVVSATASPAGKTVAVTADKSDENAQVKRKRYGSAWCSALNCKNNRKQRPKLSFFKFPLDPDRSKKWVIASRRKDLLDKDAQYLYKNCKICSEHFETKMFLNDLKNRLHEHAVPTIFFESKSVLTPSQKKAAKKRPLSPCDEFYFQGSTNEQVLQPRIERVWIKSETAEQSIYKTSPEVKDEIDIEDCSDLSHQTNQAGADVCQQDSDSITLPEMVYIKEERVTEEEEVLCPENFMSFEMTVKEEIPEYLDSEKQQESSE